MNDINLNLQDLIRFSESEDVELRKGVASYKKTPKALLERLSNDVSIEVKIRVCENFNTAPETLDKLSLSNNKLIKLAVSRNENISLFTIQRLWKEDFSIRNELMQNKNLPKDFLLEFSEDEDKYISDRAKNILKEIETIDIKKTIETIERERRRDILEKFSNHQNSEIRCAVAKNINTPKDILKKMLFGDENSEVKTSAEITLKILFKNQQKEGMK